MPRRKTVVALDEEEVQLLGALFGAIVRVVEDHRAGDLEDDSIEQLTRQYSALTERLCVPGRLGRFFTATLVPSEEELDQEERRARSRQDEADA